METVFSVLLYQFCTFGGRKLVKGLLLKFWWNCIWIHGRPLIKTVISERSIPLHLIWKDWQVSFENYDFRFQLVRRVSTSFSINAVAGCRPQLPTFSISCPTQKTSLKSTRISQLFTSLIRWDSFVDSLWSSIAKVGSKDGSRLKGRVFVPRHL